MQPQKPPHLLLDNSIYFITSRTYRGQRIFNSDEKKTLLISSLKAAVRECNNTAVRNNNQVAVRKRRCELFAWVVLENHFDSLVKCQEGKYIPKMMNLVHGRASYYINQIDNKRGRLVFNNYWDRIIRDQEDLNIHLNYILYNPVKHGYVDDPKDYKMVWVRGL